MFRKWQTNNPSQKFWFFINILRFSSLPMVNAFPKMPWIFFLNETFWSGFSYSYVWTFPKVTCLVLELSDLFESLTFSKRYPIFSIPFVMFLVVTLVVDSSRTRPTCCPLSPDVWSANYKTLQLLCCWRCITLLFTEEYSKQVLMTIDWLGSGGIDIVAVRFWGILMLQTTPTPWLASMAHITNTHPHPTHQAPHPDPEEKATIPPALVYSANKMLLNIYDLILDWLSYSLHVSRQSGSLFLENGHLSGWRQLFPDLMSLYAQNWRQTSLLARNLSKSPGLHKVGWSCQYYNEWVIGGLKLNVEWSGCTTWL